jgi:hypothetical protein
VARRLGFNDAKTKMLIGQSAADLAELERTLLKELDEQPGKDARPKRKPGPHFFSFFDRLLRADALPHNHLFLSQQMNQRRLPEDSSSDFCFARQTSCEGMANERKAKKKCQIGFQDMRPPQVCEK